MTSPAMAPSATNQNGEDKMVETFFKTIKSELIWPVSWQTRSQAENAVARYIDGFYNPIRRHSTLG